MVVRLAFVVLRFPERETIVFSLVSTLPDRVVISPSAVRRRTERELICILIGERFPERVAIPISLVSVLPERNAILQESAFCARESVK